VVESLQAALSDKDQALSRATRECELAATTHSAALAAAKEAEEEQRSKASAAAEQLRDLQQELAAAQAAAVFSAEQAKIAQDKQLEAEQKLEDVQSNYTTAAASASAAAATATPSSAAASSLSTATGTASAAAAAESKSAWEAERREWQLKQITWEDELASAKDDVAAKEKAASDYAAIARGHEATMEAQRVKLRDAEVALERASAELASERKVASELRTNLDDADKTAADARGTVEKERDEAQAQVAECTSTIERLKLESTQQQASIAALKEDVESRHKQWREARSEHLSELQKHSQTAEEMQALSASVSLSLPRLAGTQ
jgi:hypothetical protein